MKYHQQGDVVCLEIKLLPKGEKELIQDKVLALGEATGHAHRIIEDDTAVQVFRILGNLYVQAAKEFTLKHEEHKPIQMPPGNYEVRIVREADHLAGIVRKVAD